MEAPNENPCQSCGSTRIIRDAQAGENLCGTCGSISKPPGRESPVPQSPANPLSSPKNARIPHLSPDPGNSAQEGKKPEYEYLRVLEAVADAPFGMGKKLLIAFLSGNPSNPSIARNRLHRYAHFGCLSAHEDIGSMIDWLYLNGLLGLSSFGPNRFMKTYSLTEKGRRELKEPQLYRKKLSFGLNGSHPAGPGSSDEGISREYEGLFARHSAFLSSFNQGQKKAIVCPASHVLCIAGAGSGKTAVLAKRIEFLVKHRSAEESGILAITFTRKAREEMESRLCSLGMDSVRVETFNSFCEKVLREHGHLFYEKEVRVASFSDKLGMVRQAFSSLGMDAQEAVSRYFGAQARGKDFGQLLNSFVGDCFSIRDYFKLTGKGIPSGSDAPSRIAFRVCRLVDSHMKEGGLRDFSDQLMDCIALFKQAGAPEGAFAAGGSPVPSFSHILVDEYQDVNAAQVELLRLLNPPSLFCVGDPRQSIFGWRGSDVRQIMDFPDMFPSCEVVSLDVNYRSCASIISLMNASISSLGLADITADSPLAGEVSLNEFRSEKEEAEFVARSASALEGRVFVLARTNKQLEAVSSVLSSSGVEHALKEGDSVSSRVTLSTVHSIKGMEADSVFVVGCSSVYFPCKVPERPVDASLSFDYDIEEEERRLFYVALSRARERLFLSFCGRVSPFITRGLVGVISSGCGEAEMVGRDGGRERDAVGRTRGKEKVGVGRVEKTRAERRQVSGGKTGGEKEEVEGVPDAGLVKRLKEWRLSVSRERGVPAFVIFSDRTLRDLALKKPKTSEELLGVFGFGRVKVREFGEGVLEVINGGDG